MSVNLNAAVRERDGHRCTRCGVTSAEHAAKDKDNMGLIVHWLGEGDPADAAGYVLVCLKCFRYYRRKWRERRRKEEAEEQRRADREQGEATPPRPAWDPWSAFEQLNDAIRGIMNGLDTDLAAGVLGLPRDATREQIEAAYRRLARQHHPDRGGTAEQFRRVQEAYERLTRTEGGTTP